MELFYSPKDRRITDKDGNGYSTQGAKQMLAAGEVTDWNMAFRTLSDHDFDKDAVDTYYKSFNSPH